MGSNSFRGNNHGLQVGDNRGSINAEFHLPPERPETPPSPLSTVPFTRDPDFVRRDTLLDQIYSKSSVPGSRIALVGLGGVGKSQLAIEYSYQVRSESQATWVFWVHASNAARFEQSFRSIADQVKIPGRQDPKVNILNLVENWLRDEKKGKWVCILDNVDDDQLLCSVPAACKGDPISGLTNASTKPLLEYVPRSKNGSTIITSRTREVAFKMVDHKDLIKVQPMERSQALDLLQRKLAQPEESQESRQLVEELEFMPLAIVQAASYIINRAPRCSVSQYLSDFRKNDHKVRRLLEMEASYLYRRDWEASNSILVTWQISFDYIQRTKPSAADLLSLMSFFDRQGIPASLLRARGETNRNPDTSLKLSDNSSDDGEVSVSDIDSDFDDDITILSAYSFITIGEDITIFTMHRLVQLTMRMWLKSYRQVEQWKEKFISSLCQQFPTGEYENWESCRLLFPHVKCAILQQPKSRDSLLEWAALLYKGAYGQIADVREMALKSKEQRVKLLSGEDEKVLESTRLLAKAYLLEGWWGEAERLQLQVIETCKIMLGDDHPDTLTSMVNLAETYGAQGRWKEAEQLQVQAMETRKMKLGENHTDTLWSMGYLAWTYRSQGRWEEAIKLFLKVTEASRMRLGEDHPSTLLSMAALGSTYINQGRLEEAEQLYLQMIETSKMKLGEEHPTTLSGMNNLALTCWSRGRWEEAERLLVQVMKTSKTKFGEDHPTTLMNMANLAVTYVTQGRWKDAERLLVQVMESRKTKFGEDHPETLLSMANLAVTYGRQGRWKDAERLLVQVIETRKTKFGEDHPDTLSSTAGLASTYRNQGRWEEAEQLNVQVIETRKMKLGEYHPDTLSSMADLASTYRSQGRWEEAEQLNIQVIKTRKMKLGEDHPDTLSSMADLASTYRNQGRWEEAEQLNVQVIETRKMKLGEYHPDTLSSMANLASAWKSSGRHAEAINLLRECLTKQKQTLGLNHPTTLSNSQTLLEWETEGLNIHA
ncbi:unnamed protein product [Penicillium palitans]